MCEYLEAVRLRQIRKLVINVPPGCSKSLFVSVLWPAYVWTTDPGHRFIAVSYSDKVVLRDAERHRSLVKSDWYRGHWPGTEIPSGKAQSDAVSVFRTTRGGMRYSVTVRGQLTGEHGDTMLVDDPIDPLGAMALSGVELDEVLSWWHGTASTRFRDHSRSAKVCIMQRLHQRDLAAEMIREGAEVLCLPLRYEAKHPHRWARDPRTRDGELLTPERIGEAEANELAINLGPTQTAGQLQQRPAPAEGGIFREAWFKYWTELPTGGTWALSVDCAFKDAKDSSFVVVQCWYQHGPNHYLVDQTRERMDFTRTVGAVEAMAGRYPKAHRKLVEAKANGVAVVNVLKTKLSGLELVEPEGGKEARANAVQPLVSAGNVFLPDPERAVYPDGRRGAPWVKNEFLPEVTTFPNAANDDVTDTMTQYLNKAAGGHSTAGLVSAMSSFLGKR